MKSLVTGGSGFIASHLVPKLVNRGDVVTVIDHVSPADPNRFPESVETVSLGIESEDLGEFIRTVSPDRVFHLAAQSYPTVSWEEPRRTFDTNVWGTHNVLRGVLEANREATVVIASTSGVYGAVPLSQVPVSEEYRPSPLQPYGVSKLATEAVARMFVEVYGLRCVIPRIFNTIGPGKRGDVVGDVCERIVEIERSDAADFKLRTGALDTKRAFVDVRDTVDALISLAEAGEPGEAYNVSGPAAVAVQEVVDQLVKLANRPIDTVTDKALLRPSDEAVIWGDNSKILSATGWEPKIDLRQTLADSLDWFRVREPG